MTDLDTEIAQAAARLIAEEGLSWGAAKLRALKDLGLPPRTALPSHDAVEDALREHLALFQADTQPAELRALRETALRWMDRLADFEPQLTGAVWRGTANHLSDLHLLLYSDDPKAPEIALINAGLSPEPGMQDRDERGQALTTIALLVPCPALRQQVGLHLTVHDTRARRGSLLPDARGRSERGDRAALRALLETPAP
jgi:hypothetical protein